MTALDNQKLSEQSRYVSLGGGKHMNIIINLVLSIGAELLYRQLLFSTIIVVGVYQRHTRGVYGRTFGLFDADCVVHWALATFGRVLALITTIAYQCTQQVHRREQHNDENYKFVDETRARHFWSKKNFSSNFFF